VTYKNGDVFRGNFKDGRPSGMGKLIFSRSLKVDLETQNPEDGEYVG